MLELRAAPAAQGVLAAVQTLREMNADNLRKVPADAPTAFIKPRWKPLVITRKASTGNSTKSARLSS
ncbi:hypothetical protein [Enterobacter kobei]